MKTVAYIRATNIYNDSRASKEITALLEDGYTVHVLGWNRSGNAKEKCDEVFKKYDMNVVFHFFDVTIVSLGIRNIGLLYKWYRWALKTLKMINRNKEIDVVHVCDLDAGIVGLKFCRGRSCCFVYDIYDYYIDSHNIPSILEKYVEKLEIKIINKSNLTIICTEERCKQIKKATPKQVLVIHNSPDVNPNTNLENQYDYVYCGTLDDGRLIKEFLEEYEHHQDLRVGFAGFGRYAHLCEKLNEEYENFHFFGTIPYAEVLELEMKSSLISAIYEPTKRNHQLCAPNKFYEAMALSKPVIVCGGTGIDEIVKRENTGVVIEYDVHQLYDAIRRLILNENSEMGIHGRKIYDSKYSWSIMKRKFLREYRNLF